MSEFIIIFTSSIFIKCVNPNDRERNTATKSGVWFSEFDWLMMLAYLLRAESLAV
jgi:hypothetical protein